jgi:hypothetical protein
MVEPEMASPIIREGASEQALDDVDRFRQALVALAAAGPAGTDDVFVEALAGAEPEREAIVAEQPQGGGALGHDRGMVAHGRAGHRRHQAHPPRRIGDRAQDRPGQRCMTLFFEPGGEVVRNCCEGEPRLFGALGVVYQSGGPVFFGHELVAELEHTGFPSSNSHPVHIATATLRRARDAGCRNETRRAAQSSP